MFIKFHSRKFLIIMAIVEVLVFCAFILMLAKPMTALFYEFTSIKAINVIVAIFCELIISGVFTWVVDISLLSLILLAEKVKKIYE